MTKERANHKTADEKEIIQWHPAFYCAIQWEFREDAEYLEFSGYLSCKITART